MITSQHPEWPEFKRQVLLTEIESLRDQLEHAQPEFQTATLRGRIAALRKIIATVEPDHIDAIAPNYRT